MYIIFPNARTCVVISKGSDSYELKVVGGVDKAFILRWGVELKAWKLVRKKLSSLPYLFSPLINFPPPLSGILQHLLE